jgi:K+/H+ antiporter YhaU regulatory subunit KhtT
MPTDFLQRARKELTVNVEGLREIILSISERVNRKVQVLKLHWQASQLSDQIDAVYQRLGQQVDTVLAGAERRIPEPVSRDQTDLALAEAVGQLSVLRRELLRVDGLVRELEADALRDELLKLQQDLGTRGLALERVLLSPQSPAAGRPLNELGLPTQLRLIAVLRGPTLLDRPGETPLRDGDVVVLLGRPADLKAGQRLLEPPPL